MRIELNYYYFIITRYPNIRVSLFFLCLFRFCLLCSSFCLCLMFCAVSVTGIRLLLSHKDFIIIIIIIIAVLSLARRFCAKN
jgi:hypothetical protein